MLDEPVRGRSPDPSLYSLPGIECLQAMMHGLVPRAPVARLTGAFCSHAEPGSVVGFFPELAWFQLGDGTVDTRFASALALESVALSAAPPGMKARLVAVSVSDLRRCTLKSRTLVGRAHLLKASMGSSVGDVVYEDALGRAVCHATGRLLIEPMDPPPPPARPLSRVEEPVYATPDPYLRPIGRDALPSLEAIDDMGGWLAAFSAMAAGMLPHPPVWDLMGIRLASVSDGLSSGVMPAREWLVGYYPDELSSGYLAVLAHLALTTSSATLAPVGHCLLVLEQSLSLLRPVPPDGRDLLVRASVTHQGQFLVSTAEVTDADGNQVAFGSQTSQVVPRQADRAAGPRERILATVLFTDIVGSTEKADQLGDARWRELLEQHHRMVRAQLQAFKGREVKTTGDGFLATFDAPTRAVQCARAIRDGLRPLGLEIRAGLHTGECEEMGADVAGVAVHVASRVQSAASPGEILVSGTVRDLISGSGLRLADRGVHELKGLDGKWALFAVEG